MDKTIVREGRIKVRINNGPFKAIVAKDRNVRKAQEEER